MLTLVAATLALGGGARAKSLPPEPVFHLGLDGRMTLRSGKLTPRLRPGTSVMSAAGHTGVGFDGRLCGIELGDVPALRLTRSLSVACWVRLNTYVSGGPGAQIVFRGDDRIALDPYSLTVLSDGRVYFSVQNGQNQADHVSAPIALGRWTHVLGSLDDRTGQMALWIDGVRADGLRTRVRPMGRLDSRFSPGVSIGNIQNGQGPYNQPLDGAVADVAIYDRAVTPSDIQLALYGWNRPIE